MIFMINPYPDNFEQLAREYKKKKEAGENMTLWLQDAVQRLYKEGYECSMAVGLLRGMLEEKLKWLV